MYIYIYIYIYTLYKNDPLIPATWTALVPTSDWSQPCP